MFPKSPRAQLGERELRTETEMCSFHKMTFPLSMGCDNWCMKCQLIKYGLLISYFFHIFLHSKFLLEGNG